jgi:hypothetical protein
MNIELLDVRNPAVIEFLWQHLEPHDLRWDFTRLDAINDVTRSVMGGDAFLLGDLEVGVVFRVVARNPKVIEPHIMGDGTKIRSAADMAVDVAWSLGYEKIVIYTQHDVLSRILQKIGFTHHVKLPGIHMGEGGQMLDINILTMEKPHET